MRIFYSTIVFFLLAVFSTFTGDAQIAPSLGSSAQFALFTCAGDVSNAHISNIIGDVGTNSGINTWYGNVNGNLHVIVPDSATVYCSAASTVAFLDIRARTAIDTLRDTIGRGDTLIHGVHRIATNGAIAGNLYLNARGNASAVFIIQVGNALSVLPNARIKLINGALACNVFWQVGATFTTATDDSIKGNFFCNGAITLGQRTTLIGRAFTINGNIFADSTKVFLPLGCDDNVLMGPTAPYLGGIACYELFTSLGQLTNPGGSRAIGGNIGTDSIGTDPTPDFSGITGTIDYNNTATAAGVVALNNLWIYGNKDSMAANIILSFPSLLGYGMFLTPHVYLLDTNTILHDSLIFDAQNNPYAIFFIQVNGSLTTRPNSLIKLINSAKASNIFWFVKGDVSLGANSIFKGSILSYSGNCVVGNGVNISGRILGMNGTLAYSGSSATLPVDGIDICLLPFINRPPIAVNDSDTLCANTTDFVMHVQANDHDPDGNRITSFIIGGPNHGTAFVAGPDIKYTPPPNFWGDDTITYRLLDNGYPNKADTAQVFIHILAVPYVDAGPQRIICFGDSVIIGDTARPGINYKWQPSLGINYDTLPNPTVSPTITTTYLLLDTFRYTGCFNRDSVLVTVNPLPLTFAGQDTTICFKDSVKIGDTLRMGYAYTWKPSSGLSGASISNPMASPLATTTYVLIDTILATGCHNSDTIVVTVNPLPKSNLGPDRPLCIGSAIQIGDTREDSTVYYWSPSVGLDSIHIAKPIASPTLTTTYILLDTNLITGCHNTDTLKITVNPVPVANAGRDTTICNKTTVTLGSAATGGYSYSWAPNFMLSSATTAQPQATPSITTTYVVTATIIATGCAANDSVLITVLPSPPAIVGADTTICAGDTLVLGGANTNGNTYTWSPSIGLSSVNTSITRATPETTITYTLTEFDGRCTDTNSVEITVKISPTATTGPDMVIPPKASIVVGAAAVAGNNYLWQPGAGVVNPTDAQPTITPHATTTYSLTETVASTGCSRTNTLLITVKEPEYFNGFSPNGDGVNDVWEIPVLNFFPDNKVTILNRWGSEVWSTTNYDNKVNVFAGKNQSGNELPDGTYYYSITYSNEEKHGWVLIKR